MTAHNPSALSRRARATQQAPNTAWDISQHWLARR